MENFFTILGGMGTLATESFVRLLNKRTPALKDQDYLDYLVVNHASIPDRTSHLLDPSKENPKEKLAKTIQIHSTLDPKFFVLTCNTAHYLYDDLQEITHVPILHMPRIAVEALSEKFPKAQYPRIAFLGTEGSVKAGIYQQELERAGYECLIPTPAQQQKINNLIYRDIKEQGHLNFKLYLEILDEIKHELGCSVMILGCTELSYIQEIHGISNKHNIIDAQSETVDKVLQLMERHESA